MKYILSLALLSISLKAYSTSCWNEFIDQEFAEEKGAPVIQYVVERSSIVFTGTAAIVKKTIIEDGGQAPYISEIQALFEVEDSIKGNISGRQLIHSSNICPCKYDFKSGVTYLVFADEKDGVLYAANCKYISPLHESSINEVREAVRVDKALQTDG